MGRHGPGEVLDVAADGAAPAHKAWFLVGLKADNDGVEPVAHLLERLT